MSLVTGLIIFLSVVDLSCATVTTISTSSTGASQTVENKILSLPLVPHHVQKERRNRERQRHLLSSPSLQNDLAGANQDRRRRAEGETQDPRQIGALYMGYGTHYADLWCGTPPQRQTVIVDTGSGVTAFPSSGCTGCGVPDYHIDLLFTEADSSTFQKLGCDECLRGSCASSGDGSCKIGMSYQEGSSWNAYEGKDLCYVGGLHEKAVTEDATAPAFDDVHPESAAAFAFPMKFGCQTHLTGLFKTQLADGIMGMDDASASFWSQMFSAHKISVKQFSLCFSRQPTPDRKGTEAGAMTMGGYDTRLHDKSDMVFASTDHSGSGFYAVHVRKMYLRAGGGGDSASSTDVSLDLVQIDASETDLNRGQVIVDSGTTDTYFTRRIATAFNNAFKELTGKDYKNSSMKLTKTELDSYPTILLQLVGDETMNTQVRDHHEHVVGLADVVDPEFPNDVILAVPPSHYFEYDDHSKKYVPRFYTDEGSGSVLGANSMMGHDIFFDIDNKRVGFAESTCDYTGLVKTYSDGSWTPPDPGRQETPDASNSNESNVPDGDSGSGTIAPAVGGACSSLSCQMSFVLAVVAAVGIVAFVVVRRTPAGPDYALTSELELGTTNKSDETDEEFVRYRDAPADDEIIAAPPGTGYSDDEDDETGKVVGKLS
jgi:hypothetical protein